MILANGDYPIDLRSDYRGNEITLYFKFDSNAKEVVEIADKFNNFASDKLKSFANTNIEQKLFITGIEFYEVNKDNISDGCESSVSCYFDCKFSKDICKIIKKDYKAGWKLAWKLVESFENKINASLQNNPLSKDYLVEFKFNDEINGYSFSDCNINGCFYFAKK